VSSSSNPDVRLNRKAGWILAGTVLLSVFVYLLASRLYYAIGFPLDDAWIHQTYARNLAFDREWAFLPGHPSGGSTSPLWSGLLAIGYWLHLAPYLWTYALGACELWIGAMLAEATVRVLVPDYRSRLPWVGIVLALEWHLVWAALSGMETMLYALLVIGNEAVLTIDRHAQGVSGSVEATDLGGLGRLMDLNQTILSSLLLSTEEIEAMCRTARESGAVGAKLTGAGGGGCVVALAGESPEPIVESWEKLGFRAFVSRVVPARVRASECRHVR
jgi:hypothetical protein